MLRLLFSVEEGSFQILLVLLRVGRFRVPNTISFTCGVTSAEVAASPEGKQITGFYNQT